MRFSLLNVRQRARSTEVAQQLLRFAFGLTFIAAAWRGTLGVDTIAYIGSFNLTVHEPLLIMSVVAVSSMWMTHDKEYSVFSILSIALASILAINLLRGFASGPAGAITSLRSNGAFYVLLLAALPFGRQYNYCGTVLNYLFRCAYFLTAVVFLRVLVSPDFLRVAAVEEEGRAMSAQGALIIAVAAVAALSLVLRQKQPNKMLRAFVVFSLAVLLTRQGTASACLIAGSFITLALQHGLMAQQRRFVSMMVLALCALLYISFAQLVTFDTLISIAPETWQETLLNRQNTLDARELIWMGVREAHADIGRLSQFIGVPSGVKPTVMIDHPSWGYVAWEFGYHSMYFSMLMFFGMLGMVLLITLYGIGALRAIKNFNKPDFLYYPSYALCLALVIMCALFSYSYDLPAEGALFLSLSLINMPARGHDHRQRGPASGNRRLRRRSSQVGHVGRNRCLNGSLRQRR